MSKITEFEISSRKEALSNARKLIINLTDGKIEAVGSLSSSFGYKISSQNGKDSEGIWAQWRWNGEKFELTNDRYGFFPLYYFESDGNFGISSSVTALLNHSQVSKKLNDPAMAVFLRLGFFIGNDTPFRDIKPVPPDCRMSWQDGNLQIDSKGNICPPLCNDISRKSAVKEFGELFQSAVEQMLPTEEDKVAVPLSGGKDSRHILFALKRAGYTPDACLTMLYYPPKSNEDAEIAKLVAQALGTRHITLPQSQSRLYSELRNNILTNFCADEHSWIIALADYIKNEKYTLLYDGIAGGVLSTGKFLTREKLRLYESGDFHSLAELLLRKEGYLTAILPKHLYQRWNRHLAVSHLAKELVKYAHTPNPIAQFLFWNRTRREIALSPWSILANNQTRVFAPFLADQVYDFLASLPVSYLREGQFHLEAINSLYPKYSWLPFESKSKLKPTNEWRQKLTGLKNNSRHFAQFGQELLAYTFSQNQRNHSIDHLFLLRQILSLLLNIRQARGLLHSVLLSIYLFQLSRTIDSLEDNIEPI